MALIPCSSFRMALAILKQMGIPCDRAYRVVCFEKQPVTGLLRREVPGVHIYINNGDGINVATFTPCMDALHTYEDLPNMGRCDGTPLDRREAYMDPKDFKMSFAGLKEGALEYLREAVTVGGEDLSRCPTYSTLQHYLFGGAPDYAI